MRGLAKKRAVVTGGARGIGRAAVERLYAEGARVAEMDCDSAGCATLRAELPEVMVVEADVTDAEAVEMAFAQITGALDGLDILLNNAGISAPYPFLELPVASWRRTLAVDIDGVFYCAQSAARRMRHSGSGVIINMGSVSGMLGMPGYADYNAAKAAVIELTRTLALELAPELRDRIQHRYRWGRICWWDRQSVNNASESDMPSLEQSASEPSSAARHGERSEGA